VISRPETRDLTPASLKPGHFNGMLRIEEGTLVSVDNENGKFNIHPINPGLVQ
jgi:hypothetical protein